jgi:hypothetical protein
LIVSAAVRGTKLQRVEGLCIRRDAEGDPDEATSPFEGT